MPSFPTGSTYGAYFFSTLLCATFWGVSCMQMLTYFARFVRHDRWFKAIVAIIVAINTVQTALVVHGAYAHLVTNFGDFSFFEVVLPVSWAGFFLSTIVCVSVQGIFVIKAYRLSETRSRMLLLLCVSMVFFELGAATYCVVTSFRCEDVPLFFCPQLKGVVVSYLAVMAILNVAIAFSLVKSLRKLHRHVVTAATSKFIQHLITFSIFTGILTALFALLVIITYVGFPNTAIYLIFDLPLSSLYCITLLANLNSQEEESASSRQLSTFRAATGPIILSTIVGLQDYQDCQSDEERASDEIEDWK